MTRGEPLPPSPVLADAVQLLHQFYPPLSEAPDELAPGDRYADYSVEGAELVISVPWRDAEDLTAIVHRLAAENGWGFWDLSASDGTIWRPDPAGQPPREPIAGMTLTIEDGGVHEDPSPALIAASIDWIVDHRGPSFGILDRADDDYIQYAGGRDGLTVELRRPIAAKPGFRHQVATTLGDTEGHPMKLAGATRSFEVLSTEVLSAPQATELVLALAAGESEVPSLAWRDITDTFTD